jgi:hypothetical protein
MKSTLTFSFEEAGAFIYDRLNADRRDCKLVPHATSVTVVIEPPARPQVPLSKVLEVVRGVDGWRTSGSEGRLRAIKAVREWTSKNGMDCGLAEAKFFVEGLVALSNLG